MTRAEFDAYCADLSVIVEHEAKRTLRYHDFTMYIETERPPATYAELRSQYRMLRVCRARYFPVLSTHCEDVIYDSAHVNKLYRAWHDLTHIELDRGFDFHSELAVARFKSQRIPVGPLRDIMLADAVGESEFAEATGGKFPRRQRDWAFDYVQWGFLDALNIHKGDTA